MRSILAASALLALGACRDPYPTPRARGAGAIQPHHGGTLRFALDSDVRTLDPHVGYDEYSGVGIRLLFDTLVQYAPGSTELVPGLAERWDGSPDGLTWTFHLRRGVRFHSGRALTADDVQRSFERMLDPARVPCPGTNFYHLIDGFDDYQTHRARTLRGVEVLDPYTVRFRLTQADQTFLNAMSMPFAAPIDTFAARAMGNDAFGQAPVGTGPFVIDRWELGARIVFRRNPTYWNAGHPYLDQIVMETSIASQLQFMRFQHDDIEYVYDRSLITADYLWVQASAAWRPYTQTRPHISVTGIAMNTEMPPWTNVHLRRALAFAIDRDALSRRYNYRYRPLGGLYPPGLPGYDPALPGAHHYDLAAARREMALAGYANGLPGEHAFWTVEGDTIGELIQADLARIGIRIRLRMASFGVFLEQTLRRHAVELGFGAWEQDFPDPSNFVETLFSSRNIADEGSQNQSFYANPALDALLDRARVEPDRARRIAMYQQAERIVVADAPWAFLLYPTLTEIVQPYVRGYVVHPVYSHDLRDVWLDEPTRPFARREPGALEPVALLAAALPAHAFAP